MSKWKKPYKGKGKTYRFPIRKTEGVDLMQNTLVVIMGLPVAIKYAIHDPAYVEWTLDGVMADCLEDYPNDEMKLLEVLLRTHYSEFIESCCREACYYDNYASQAAVADDWADTLSYVTAAKNLFKDKDEDIPF